MEQIANAQNVNLRSLSDDIVPTGNGEKLYPNKNVIYGEMQSGQTSRPGVVLNSRNSERQIGPVEKNHLLILIMRGLRYRS